MSAIRIPYHTTIKLLAKYNVLPASLQALIPRPNISRWKNQDFSRVFGQEYIQAFENMPELVRELSRYKNLVKALIALIRIKNAFVDFVTRRFLYGKIDDVAREMVVTVIDRVKHIIPLQRAVRYFKITLSQFYLWSHQIKVKCLETITDLCPHTYPGQLSKSEIRIMSDFLQDKQYEGWPVFAIAWDAIKRGILYVCPATWYKYAKILGFNPKKAKHRRKNHVVGIRTDKKILKIIHADTTVFRPLDHSKVFIYVVMDNCSRFILSWFASLECSARLCIQNLTDAYLKYIRPRMSYPHESVDLITDDGPENKTIHSFTADIGIEIRRLVAQKDIIFSNSMIEAVNKTLKYQFLYHQQLADAPAVLRYLEKAIPGYNTRPHSALNGLSPLEVFKGIELDKNRYYQGFKEARIHRIEENRKVRCLNCENT